MTAGKWTPIAANYQVSFPNGAGFEWTSIELNIEIMAILTDGSMATRMPLLSRIYDLKAWFPQIAIDEVNQSKQSCFIRGILPICPQADGQGAASHSVKLFIMLLLRLLMEVAVVEGWGLQSASTEREKTSFWNGAGNGGTDMARNHSNAYHWPSPCIITIYWLGQLA